MEEKKLNPIRCSYMSCFDGVSTETIKKLIEDRNK